MANMRTAPLVLDEAAVRRHLRMADLLPAMERALIDFSAGKVVQPVRAGIAVEPAGGFFFWMPAHSEALGLKLVTFYPSNAARGLPTHMASIFLLEPETGAPLALIDARLITEMRTAAVSAIATRLLSAPDAGVLAILGSGVQARSHYEALTLVRNFSDVRVWSRTAAHAQRFADEIGATATTAERAVEGADVVVTVTGSRVPVLRGAWLKHGCHVNAVGACLPQWRELDDAAMAGWYSWTHAPPRCASPGTSFCPMPKSTPNSAKPSAARSMHAPARPPCSSRWGWRPRIWPRPCWCTGAPSPRPRDGGWSRPAFRPGCRPRRPGR